MQVVVYGEISVYEPRGTYQLIVRAAIEDGVGRLQMEFERLKKQLAAEGLFDPERKKPLPDLPSTIGVITSPTGAAVQDFLRILRRRNWRGRIIVLPVKVQGEGAGDEIVRALQLAERLKSMPPGTWSRPKRANSIWTSSRSLSCWSSDGVGAALRTSGPSTKREWRGLWPPVRSRSYLPSAMRSTSPSAILPPMSVRKHHRPPPN